MDLRPLSIIFPPATYHPKCSVKLITAPLQLDKVV